MFNGFSISDIGLVFVAILISMAAHEAMHAYVAHALGDTTAKEAGRLTLNPFKHVDLLTTVLLPLVMIVAGVPPIFIARPVPFDPERLRFAEYGAALMAVAGPLTNLGLAVVASFFIRFLDPRGVALDTLILFMQINISFFVFNMIPLPPLDGSRLLYAFAPEPVREVMDRIERMGYILLIAVFLLLSSFILPVITNIVNSIFVFLLR